MLAQLSFDHLLGLKLNAPGVRRKGTQLNVNVITKKEKKATSVVIITYSPIVALNLEVFVSLSLFMRIKHEQKCCLLLAEPRKISSLLKCVEIIVKLSF
jgi:hypothetical protein